METFPLNNLAEKFEVDRSVMVKAMRNVPPDLVRKGTPLGQAAGRGLECFRLRGHAAHSLLNVRSGSN